MTIPRYLELAWGRQLPSRRGPHPTLTLSVIAKTAVNLADTEGLAAVTMQAVAKGLAVTPMSLYRYLASKEELLALMVDEAVGPPPVAVAKGKWRPGLKRWTRTLADRRLHHPWTVEIRPVSPPLTPNVVTWTELGLTTLSDSPLTTTQRLSVLLALDGWSLQHVRQCVSMGLVGVPIADSAASQYGQQLALLISPERFPQLSQANPANFPNKSDYYDDEFEQGCELLLDGVAAMIARA